MKEKVKMKLPKLVIVLLCLLLAILLIAAIYAAYVYFTYYRIEDMQPLTPVGNASASSVSVGESYTIVTQNVGFGSYTADFTFFMDGGKQSWGNSKESVISCIDQAIEATKATNPDFVLVQELDSDSTRSYHVDQQEMFRDGYEGFQSVVAVNFHSAFLMYPFYQPHGASNSGIMTLSKYTIQDGLRRSFPISTGFSRFVDLDRCFSISRIETDNGKELIVYNVHSSAYGGSDEIRTGQMNMLFSDMAAEYAKGNYVLCGGDFNHDFTGDSSVRLNNLTDTADYGWAQPFPVELIPEGIHQCLDYSTDLVSTSRNCDIPYGEDSFVIVLDGYFVSDNIEVEYLENIQTDYVYSDHNPVVMTFRLK